MIRTDEVIAQVTESALCVVSPEATLHEVVDELVMAGQALALVMANERVEGVISEGDIVRAIYDGADLDEVWAADVMTKEPVFVDPQTAAWDVLELMLDEHIRHVVVDRDTGPGLVGFPAVVDLVLPR